MYLYPDSVAGMAFRYAMDSLVVVTCHVHDRQRTHNPGLAGSHTHRQSKSSHSTSHDA